MRSRFTSARALWKMRISRRSSGWSTIEAIVPRILAGVGRAASSVGPADPADPDGPTDGQQHAFI